MKQRWGQAGSIFLEAVLQLGRIMLWACLLVLAALGLFAFSLSRHPMEVPHLASWLATTASGDGITVHMDKAELAWAGYHQGGGVPLVLRVNGITVRSAAGQVLLSLPSADLVVPPVDIFGGHDAILLRAKAARLAGTQAPVSFRANIWPGAGYSFARGAFFVSIGAGVLGNAAAGVPLAGASFTLTTAPGAVDLTSGQAALAPHGASAPKLSFSLSARRGTAWAGTLHATADAVHAEDLATYWPAPLLQLTRDWVVNNITAGTAVNAAFTFSFSIPDDLSGLTLDNVTGGFDGQDLTLRWLPRAPPINGLAGHFAMPDIDNAVITASAGQVQGVAIRQGGMTITGLNHRLQTGALSLSLAGAVPDVLAVINAPPLNLLSSAPAGLANATGEAQGTLTASIPFLVHLVFDDVHLNVAASIHDLAIPLLFPPFGARHGQVQLQTDGHSLLLRAQGQFAGSPASFSLVENFTGAGWQDMRLNSAAGPEIWHWLGLDDGTALSSPAAGTAPYALHLSGSITGVQTAVLRADLTPASLALPAFGWTKPAGVKGDFALTAALHNGNVTRLENFAAHAPGLGLEGQDQSGTLTFATAEIGRTQASGTLTQPATPGALWVANFSGPVLDIRQAKPRHIAPASPAAPPAAQPPPSGPGWSARLRFGALYLAAAPAPALGNFSLAAAGRGGTLLQAQGQAAGLDFTVTPLTATTRQLMLHSADAGTLLRALGEYGHMQGGTLTLQSAYGGGGPATGHATLLDARFVNAPEVTKFLQALTLYGLADAASGPGLKIARAQIPFMLQDGVLTLHQARAHSSSLGFTASGTLDLADNTCDLDTTIVPLYALNALPGKIPLIGRLFSAEKGGGLLAMRAHISGRLDDAQVRINPLSALTPGFLRGVFGLDEPNNQL